MNEAHGVENLLAVDLNLLVALDALTEERSVTRAAQRAGVTQSAMSHTLARLRSLFDDPLLVRGRAGMVPTPRAEALRVPLRSALVDLARVLAPSPEFDAAASTRRFTVACPDIFATLVLPSLRRTIAAEAPGVSLSIRTPGPGIDASLETGDLDLAILPVLGAPVDIGEEASAHHVRRTLFRDSFRAYVGVESPLHGRRRVTAKRYAAAPHIVVSPTGEGAGPIDHVLAEHGLERRVALRVPHFASALDIVAQSDVVLTAPTALRRVVDSRADIASFALPIDVPEHAITMVWHPRFSEDPGHRWFRDRVANEAKG